MAFVQDQVSGDDTGNTFTAFTCTLAAGATGGNLICVVLNHSSGIGTFTNITDTAGNTYTAVDTVTDTTNGQVSRSFYAKNITGGFTVVTANFSVGSSSIRMSVTELSGRHTTAPLGVHNMTWQTTPGTGTDGAQTTFASSGATDDVVGVIHDTGGSQASIVAGTGYTGKKQLTTIQGLVAMNEVVTGAVTKASFTVGTNGAVITAGLAFVAAGGAAARQQTLSLLGCGV